MGLDFATPDRLGCGEPELTVFLIKDCSYAYFFVKVEKFPSSWIFDHRGGSEI